MKQNLIEIKENAEIIVSILGVYFNMFLIVLAAVAIAYFIIALMAVAIKDIKEYYES